MSYFFHENTITSIAKTTAMQNITIQSDIEYLFSVGEMFLTIHYTRAALLPQGGLKVKCGNFQINVGPRQRWKFPQFLFSQFEAFPY